MKYLVCNEGHFRSKWLCKFISQWISQGKKWLIERVIYLNFFFIKKKNLLLPLFYYFEILEKIKPTIGLNVLKLKKKKIKKVKVFPYVLSKTFQYKKSICWLVKSIKLRKENSLFLRVYKEFYDILVKGVSDCLKKKKLNYKYIVMFKSNKRFKW